MNKKLMVIGGDTRQQYLYKSLKKRGLVVEKCFLEGTEGNRQAQLDLLSQGDLVILPVPTTKDKNSLYAPQFAGPVLLSEIFGAIKPGAVVFTGGPVAQVASHPDLQLVDLLEDEPLVLKNALATAEAALSILIAQTDITLHKSRVLLLGYGRIAQFLARYLQALGALVTVAARNPTARAKAVADNCTAMDFTELDPYLLHYEIIVNTVPALVLDKQRLLKVDRDCYLLDLASNPGGIDFNAAKTLQLQTNHALALPGKYSPKSAAAYIEQKVLAYI